MSDYISRRNNFLMNCLWCKDISPEDAASALNMTPEEFFDKIFENVDFTIDEIRKLTAFLALTEEEVDMIFF